MADTIEKALTEFKQEGYDAVVMYPYGFFADNSETEYDARKLLERAGLPLTQYVRCLNDSEPFGRWLAGRVALELQALYTLQKTFESLEERRP